MTFEEFKEKLKNEEARENCPVAPTIELLSGRWTSRIVFELEKHKSVRFGVLKRNLNGITNTVLSSSLKELEKEQIIVRKQYDEMPVRVEYSLTEKGRDMLPIYYEMALWGAKYYGHK